MDIAATASLLAGLREGDETAFQALVDHYQESIRGYTALWAPARDEADDIAQEVFLVALREIDSFDPERDLKDWLLGIAKNLTRHAWRRRNRLPRVEEVSSLDGLLEQHALQTYRQREPLREQRQAALRLCLEALPPKARALFQRHLTEDLSSEQMAQQLSTTAGTVRAHLARIRKQLRACAERRLRLEHAG